MLVTTILKHPLWEKLEPYLRVVEHGDPLDPQGRIEFLGIPEQLSAELTLAIEMPCVACQRPIHPVRRRATDAWNRIYYSPTCELNVRLGCSRSRAAMLEYERFLGLKRAATSQLALGI